MLETFLTLAALAGVIGLWLILTQRRLVRLDENVNNALTQIGVQLSSRFDALTAILDLTKGYAQQESETMLKTLKARRSLLTAKSSPQEVMAQEEAIAEVLERLKPVVEQYPQLKANLAYRKAMDAVEAYEMMVRTSCLIYNDSVAKLNRELRLFPVALITGRLGFKQREYLEEQPARAST